MLPGGPRARASALSAALQCAVDLPPLHVTE